MRGHATVAAAAVALLFGAAVVRGQDVDPGLLSQAQLREYVEKLAAENRALRAENALLRRQIESMKQKASDEQLAALKKEVEALRRALKDAGGEVPEAADPAPAPRPKPAEVRALLEGKWVCTYRRGDVVEKEADIYFFKDGAFRRSRHDKRQVIDWNQADERCVWKVLPDGRVRATSYNNKLPKSDPPRFDYVFEVRTDGTLLGKPLREAFERAEIVARRAQAAEQ